MIQQQTEGCEVILCEGEKKRKELWDSCSVKPGYECIRATGREVEVIPEGKKIVVLCGMSGAGKSSLATMFCEMNGGEESDPVYTQAKNATTRPWQPEREAADAYIRMNRLRESRQSHTRHYRPRNERKTMAFMRREYGLLESTPYNENIYGLPYRSVVDALGNGDVVVTLESSGAEAIQLSRLARKHTVIVVFVMPGSMYELGNRMQGRDNAEGRLLTAQKEMATAREVAHVVVRNSNVEGVLSPDNCSAFLELQRFLGQRDFVTLSSQPEPETLVCSLN